MLCVRLTLTFYVKKYTYRDKLISMYIRFWDWNSNQWTMYKSDTLHTTVQWLCKDFGFGLRRVHTQERSCFSRQAETFEIWFIAFIAWERTGSDNQKLIIWKLQNLSGENNNNVKCVEHFWRTLRRVVVSPNKTRLI